MADLAKITQTFIHQRFYFKRKCACCKQTASYVLKDKRTGWWLPYCSSHYTYILSISIAFYYKDLTMKDVLDII